MPQEGLAGPELVAVVRAVHAGDVYVAPGLAFGILREMSHPRRSTRLDELTAREREVFDLLASAYRAGLAQPPSGDGGP
jgi:two-component system, NarL family, nitrate/nitrite response regulator NarL